MAPVETRNILLITADQWRGDCLSALGHPCVQTPHMDALAADGVVFRNHYANCAPCGPGRASLLTGMYMQNHRSVVNGTPLDARHTNIALELRAAGYDPLLFGYTDTSLDPRRTPPEVLKLWGCEGILPGFKPVLNLANEVEPWTAELAARGYKLTGRSYDVFNPVQNYPGAENRGRTFAPPIYKAEHSQTAFVTQKLIEHLSDCAAGWFAHVSYLRPHPPFIAPEPYNTMYDSREVPAPQRAKTVDEQAQQHPWLAHALGTSGQRYDGWQQFNVDAHDYDEDTRQARATYYGLISKVDEYIGRVIAYLKDSGAYDSTLVIVTSDHGELLGDRWLFGKRGYFDSAFHIPLIVRDPRRAGDATRGAIEDSFTEAVDIMPTILDWRGLDVPRQCDGRSLIPFCTSARAERWREEVHWEYDFRDVESLVAERALGIDSDQCTLNVIRDRQYKYVHFAGLPPLFYDLERDPHETQNLADDPSYAREMARYMSKMLSWRMGNDERVLTGMKVTRGGVIGS
ncbi:MAG: alkaline phosphatase family protein [Gammaproteobacteria bacterium]